MAATKIFNLCECSPEWETKYEDTFVEGVLMTTVRVRQAIKKPVQNCSAQDMNCIFWRSSLVCIMVRLKTLWQIKPSGKTLAGRLRIGERQRLVAVKAVWSDSANTCSWLLWLVLK